MTHLKTMQKFAALTAALTLSAALTSCGSDTSWAYRTDDGAYEVTSGMYIGLSISAYNEAYSSDGVDTSSSIFDQEIDSKSGLVWVQNRTERLAREYLAVEQKFDEYGLSFSDEEQAYIDSYISYYWSYVSSSYADQGCGETSYTNIVTNSFKQSLLFDTVYGEGGEREVSADELRALFDEQYARVNIYQIDASDEDGEALTGKALELKQNEAAALVEQMEAGESFESVTAAYDASQSDEEEEADDETADETADDSDALTDTSFYILSDNTTYPTDLVTALFAADAGSFGQYDDGEGTLYVWARYENTDDGFETYRTTILQNDKWDDFETLMQDWGNGISLVSNDASLKKHSPKNLEK
jgi:hypothetical protein